MGVVRLLCITILLVALAAAQDCNSNGWLNGHSDCVCNSGYDNAVPECGNAFGGVCNPSAANAKENKDDRFPILDQDVDTITFRNNVLKLAIVGEIVPNRKYDNIVFVQGGSTVVADKCKLTGSVADKSYWTQINQTTSGKCRDSFELAMPWTSWQDCGFVQSAPESAGDYWTYRATFVITYTDALGKPFDIPDSTYKPDLYRHSSVAYKVYVRFLKSIEIESYLKVTVNNTVSLEVAITTFDYNPADMTLTFGVSTVVLWPNKYLRPTVTLSQSNNPSITIQNSGAPSVPGATSAEDNIYCRTDMNNCLQYFEFTIKLDSGCDFNADYTISGTVATCRDNTPDCTQALQQAIISVTKSDVCGSVTAEPQITGKLMSYDEFHVAKEEYELGYRGYFEVDMTSANDFNLTWIDIWVVADMDVTPDITNIDSVALPKIQWLFKDGQKRVNGFHKYDDTDFPDGFFGSSSPVDLNVYDVTRNSNTEVVFTPKFDFLFDSRIFHIPLFGNTKKGYSLHAKGKIVYAGNEQYGKRSEEVVDFVWKTDSAGLDTSVHFGLAQPASAVSQSSNNALLASLLPVAGIALVVIAAAGVAAVVIVKRKKASFTTLAN